jgi:hypothetical protein
MYIFMHGHIQILPKSDVLELKYFSLNRAKFLSINLVSKIVIFLLHTYIEQLFVNYDEKTQCFKRTFVIFSNLTNKNILFSLALTKFDFEQQNVHAST